MGEMADMMINGMLDYQTGEYIDGDEPGYPRTTADRKKKQLLKNYKNCKELNGIAKYLQRYCDTDAEAIHNIHHYAQKHLEFQGTLKQCAKEIQKDFGGFVKYIQQLY